MPYADPEKQRQAARESARRQRAARRGSTQDDRARTVLPLPVRLKTAEDILHLLQVTIGEVRAVEQASALDRARVVGYLAGIALRAVEAADMSARIEAIEQALKTRKDAKP